MRAVRMRFIAGSVARIHGRVWVMSSPIAPRLRPELDGYVFMAGLIVDYLDDVGVLLGFEDVAMLRGEAQTASWGTLPRGTCGIKYPERMTWVLS